MGSGPSRTSLLFRHEEAMAKPVLPPPGNKPNRTLYLVLLNDGSPGSTETQLCRAHHLILYDQMGWSTDAKFIGWPFHLRADTSDRSTWYDIQKTTTNIQDTSFTK